MVRENLITGRNLAIHWMTPHRVMSNLIMHSINEVSNQPYAYQHPLWHLSKPNQNACKSYATEGLEGMPSILSSSHVPTRLILSVRRAVRRGTNQHYDGILVEAKRGPDLSS